MTFQTFTTGQVLTAAQMNAIYASTYSAKTAAYTFASGDQGKILSLEFFDHGSFMGDHCLARSAPSRPNVEDNHFAFVGGKRVHFVAINI